MHARALARLELKSDLQRALDCGEFTLRYQPIMDLAPRRHRRHGGARALAAPRRAALVQPIDFVPLLEDTGLIVPVGRFVLREACQWAARDAEGMPARAAAVDRRQRLRHASCSAPSSSTRSAAPCATAGSRPASLTLELTESVMMQDLEVSLLRLNALRALGRETRDRRLRDRLLVAELHPPVPDGHPQDRPLVPDGPQPRQRGADRSDRRSSRGSSSSRPSPRASRAAARSPQLQGIDCDYGQGFHFARPLSRQQILEMATAAQESAQVIELHRRERVA